ncbi:MAG: hypothetical protein ACRD21_24915, partial [Vicinamibacteria bacterium]
MSLRIRFKDVHGGPLQDRADVEVIDVRTDRTIERITNVGTTRPTRANAVAAGELYKVRVFPTKHRPVGYFVRMPGSGEREIDVVFPVHPDRVHSTQFPSFDELDGDLQALLGRNHIEDHPQMGPGLYDSLGDLPKAGLLNVWTKMKHTPLAEGLPVAHYVQNLYRVRGDRFFANVSLSLRDLVKTAASGGLFEGVSGVLHDPPSGFAEAGSFKTRDGYGNLQLTFFSSSDSPPNFRIDADVDDANGIEHVFQVLRNWITDG